MASLRRSRNGKPSALKKTGKPSRRIEREVAFQILYSLSFSPDADEAALHSAFANSPDLEARGLSPEPQGFTWDLVRGVWLNRAEMDAVIARYSQNWRVERMGRIELTILRIGMYEVLFAPEPLNVPPKVAINEAVELAKNFGDQSARSFVNGILDAAVREMERQPVYF